MSKNKTKFEVSISKSVMVQLWGDLPHCDPKYYDFKDLIEMTMKKMDEDKDGKVSFEDFEVVAYYLHGIFAN